MNEERLTIEVQAYTDNPDLLHELFRSIVAEGLSQYDQYGDLEPFERLSIHVERQGKRYKLLEYQKREANEPVQQLLMPGI